MADRPLAELIVSEKEAQRLCRQRPSSEYRKGYLLGYQAGLKSQHPDEALKRQLEEARRQANHFGERLMQARGEIDRLRARLAERNGESE